MNQNIRVGTSFEQFKAVLRNDFARRAVGLDISNSEAERIATDPVLARAYYDNWLRLRSKAVPNLPMPDRSDVHATPPGRSASFPDAYTPIQPSGGPAEAAPTSSASAMVRYKLGSSITGLVLSVVGYFLTGTWLSVLGLVGLGLSIYAIVAARKAKPGPGRKAGLTLGIIGTVAGGTTLILFVAFVSGYYN